MPIESRYDAMGLIDMLNLHIIHSSTADHFLGNPINPMAWVEIVCFLVIFNEGE